MDDAIRLGIVGAGRAAEVYGTALHTTEGLRVVALAGPDGAVPEGLAELPALPWFRDAADMLAGAALDAVLVASPARDRQVDVMAVVGAGTPVLCVDPLTLELPGLDAVIEEAGRRDVPVARAGARRSDAALGAAARLVAAGGLGEQPRLHYSCVRSSAAGRPTELGGPPPWIEVAFQAFELACWWLGPGLTVSADIAETGSRGELLVNGILNHASGTSVLRLSWGGRGAPDERCAVEGGGKVLDARLSRLVGTEGREHALRLGAAGAGWQSIGSPPDEGSAARSELRGFVEAVRGRRGAMVPASSARHALEALTGALIASIESVRVSLPLTRLVTVGQLLDRLPRRGL